MSIPAIQLAEEFRKLWSDKDRYCIRPVQVTIEDHVYQGVEYIDVTKTDPTCRAYREGRLWAVSLCIYCLGTTPNAYKKGGRWATHANRCFQRAGDPLQHDYYVCAHTEPSNFAFPKTDFQPWGKNFILGPWYIHNDPQSRIDDHSPKTYRRIPMTVEYQDGKPAVIPGYVNVDLTNKPNFLP